jgi:hypothetical protein
MAHRRSVDEELGAEVSKDTPVGEFSDFLAISRALDKSQFDAQFDKHLDEPKLGESVDRARKLGEGRRRQRYEMSHDDVDATLVLSNPSLRYPNDSNSPAEDQPAIRGQLKIENVDTPAGIHSRANIGDAIDWQASQEAMTKVVEEWTSDAQYLRFNPGDQYTLSFEIPQEGMGDKDYSEALATVVALEGFAQEYQNAVESLQEEVLGTQYGTE